MIVQHSMESQEHNTPYQIVDLAKRVLGIIDLDPCSNEKANRSIKATRYISFKEDGLTRAWRLPEQEPIAIWCNPPGSKMVRPSLSMQFWKILTDELHRGNVSHALYLAYSIEQLQQSQKQFHIPMLSFPLCVPRKRINFLDQYGLPQKSPTHSNAIIYLPGTVNNTDKFIREFSNLGFVKV